MANRRKRRKAHKPSPRPEQTLGWRRFPSAQTLFRVNFIGDRTQYSRSEPITKFIKPFLWIRNWKRIRQIKRATTAEELLDLVHLATGLAEPAWHKQMQQFGPEAVTLIAERLRHARDITDYKAQSVTYEQLIGELRWRDQAGAAALFACFDYLDDYGKSLAAVALGLLGAQSSANKLWTFYKRVKNDLSETYFVGALWGLIDLQDPRAADALAELLKKERYFYELCAMLSRAGDARAVLPLLYIIEMGRDDTKNDASTALVCVGHHIGREVLWDMLEKAKDALDEQYETIPDFIEEF